MSTNTTDYTFPEVWGLMTDDQRVLWFAEERAYRQAQRQSAVAPSLNRGDGEGEV